MISIANRHTLIKISYRKVPKFWNTKNVCSKLPKLQTKRPNLRGFFLENGAKGIANSADPHLTAPLGAV